MKATDHSPRRADRFAFFPRIAPLRVALCVLLLAGCTTGGPQGNGELAGRQDPATASPISVKTVMGIADRLRATGNLPSAIAFYRRAIVLDPNQVQPYIGLGDALLADGHPNPAAESFRSALAMAPNNAHALRGLGQTLVALNKPVEAVTMLDRSINVKASARAYGALGVAYNLMGKPAEATNAYKHGLTLAPDDLDLLNNYGLSQAIDGDFKGAVATLRRAAMDPRATSRNRLNLALALGLAGRDHDAAQVARIDLDERAVKNNLAYYAELRGLPPTARAQAILRPSSPVLAHLATPVCDGKPCPAPALPGDEMSAAPTTPVNAKALASASAASAKSATAEKKEKKKEAEPATASLKPAATHAHSASRHDEAGVKEAAASKSAKPKTHEASAKAAPVVDHEAKAAAADAATAMTAAATKPAPEATPDAAKSAAADSAPAPMSADNAKSTAELNNAELKKDQSQRLAMTEPAKPAEAAPTPLIPQADAAPTPAPMAADNAKPAPTSPAAAPMPITAQADQTPAKTADATAHGTDKAEATTPDATPMTDTDIATAKPMPDSMPTAPASDKPAAAPDAMPAETAQQTASAASPDKAAAATATPGDSFVAATGEPAPTTQDPAPDAAASATPSPVVKAAAIVGAKPAGKPRHWVQLGTFRSEDNAKAELKQTATDYKDLLDGLPLSIRRVDLGAVRGVYYLLRVGPAGNFSQARDLCGTLKSHKLDCMVVR